MFYHEAEKSIKYSKYHTKLILILFEPSFSERHYIEIKNEMEQYFTHLKIIIKN